MHFKEANLSIKRGTGQIYISQPRTYEYTAATGVKGSPVLMSPGIISIVLFAIIIHLQDNFSRPQMQILHPTCGHDY